MKHDEVLKLAKAAGLIFDVPPATAPPTEPYMRAIMLFAESVAGAEQDRCIDACGQVEGPQGDFSFYEGVRACVDKILLIEEK